MAKGAHRSRDLILGVLFFGALFGLGWITTQLRSVPGMGDDRQFLYVLFEDVYGVRREDQVQVHGTRFGRVNRIEPIADATWVATGLDLRGPQGAAFIPNVLMVLELDHPLTMREGYVVAAADQNLLGGKVVTIDPGTPAAPEVGMGPTDDPGLDAGSAEDLRRVTLIGQVHPHPINAIGRLVEDNLGGINEIVENVRAATGRLDDDERSSVLGYLLGNAEARDKVAGIVDAVHELAARAQQPGNVVNDLFYDGPARADLLRFLDNARVFSDGARDPATLLGALVAAESTLKRDIDRTLANVAEITERARHPDSLIGRITSSAPDALGAKADRLVGNVDRWVDDALRNPDSLIHQVAYGDLGSTARGALDAVRTQVGRFGDSILGPIEREEGILGMLLKDPDARLKAKRLISATLGIIEDAREAAPVTSLGSFIFGGF